MSRDYTTRVTPSQAEALEEAMGLEPNTLGKPAPKNTLNKKNLLAIFKEVKDMKYRKGYKVNGKTVVTTVDIIGKDGNVTSKENVTYGQLKRLVKTL